MMMRKGAITDIFLFMILAFAIVVCCGIFIYIGGTAYGALKEEFQDKTFGDANGSQIVDDTIGKTNASYQGLYWISWFLIVGMAISIFIGSYMVTTRPVMFVPYIFISVIAIIVSVGIAMAYEQIIAEPLLASVFDNMVGANYIMAYLPVWVSVISIGGGIIMASRMGSGQQYVGGGYYG